jgi:ssDNA thymidine ADP-ribosyltransferase, DarT
MHDSYVNLLNPTRALVFRITHRDNLLWVLENGLHAGTSSVRSAVWVSIGSDELINKRATHPVQIPPYGVLNDYVPFYFTPFSVMMKNIHSGRSVPRRANSDIVILVSSLSRIQELGLPFLFTDSHAYYTWANYYNNLADLDKVDWKILQARDFRRDPDDLAKFERYQAEVLVHRHCPVEAILGLVCYNAEAETVINQHLEAKALRLKVIARPNWYF